MLLTRLPEAKFAKNRSPHLPSPGGPKVPRSPRKSSQGAKDDGFSTKTAGMFRANFHRFHRLVLLRRRPFERNFSLEVNKIRVSLNGLSEAVTQDTHFKRKFGVSWSLRTSSVPFFLSIKTRNLCGEAASNDLGWNIWRKNKQKQSITSHKNSTYRIVQRWQFNSVKTNINQLSGHFWDASDLSAPSCNRFTAFKMFVTSTAVTSSCHWQSLLEA